MADRDRHRPLTMPRLPLRPVWKDGQKSMGHRRDPRPNANHERAIWSPASAKARQSDLARRHLRGSFAETPPRVDRQFTGTARAIMVYTGSWLAGTDRGDGARLTTPEVRLEAVFFSRAGWFWSGRRSGQITTRGSTMIRIWVVWRYRRRRAGHLSTDRLMGAAVQKCPQ